MTPLQTFQLRHLNAHLPEQAATRARRWKSPARFSSPLRRRVSPIVRPTAGDPVLHRGRLQLPEFHSRLSIRSLRLSLRVPASPPHSGECWQTGESLKGAISFLNNNERGA